MFMKMFVKYCSDFPTSSVIQFVAKTRRLALRAKHECANPWNEAGRIGRSGLDGLDMAGDN